MPTRLLEEEGHDITVFYANSNIAPRSEYEHRREELEKYAAMQGFEMIEGDYDPAHWEREVAPIGEAIKDFSPALGSKHVGDDAPRPESVAELLDDERRRERCRACYRMRLEEAAATAAAGGYDGLATTLAVSPYQFTDVIHEELLRACEQAGITAHFEDYRPYYDEATRAFIKQQRKAAKEAKRAAREAEEAARKEKAAEKQAYAEAQAKKRAILKAMRKER